MEGVSDVVLVAMVTRRAEVYVCTVSTFPECAK